MENACWVFLFLFCSDVATCFRVQDQEEQKLSKYDCSPKETCTCTNKKQVLGFNNLQKYSAQVISQDIILAIFTYLNDD